MQCRVWCWGRIALLATVIPSQLEEEVVGSNATTDGIQFVLYKLIHYLLHICHI